MPDQTEHGMDVLKLNGDPSRQKIQRMVNNRSSFITAQWKPIYHAVGELFHALDAFMRLGVIEIIVLLIRSAVITVDCIMNWKFLEETMSYDYSSSVAHIATRILIGFTTISSLLYLVEFLSYIIDASKKVTKTLEEEMTAGILISIVIFQELPLTMLILLIADYGQNCSFNNSVLYTLVAKLRISSGIVILLYRIICAQVLIHKFEGFKGMFTFGIFSFLTFAARVYLFVLVFIPSSIKLDILVKYGNSSVSVTDINGQLAKTTDFYTKVACKGLIDSQRLENIFKFPVDFDKCQIRLHFNLESSQKSIKFNSALRVLNNESMMLEETSEAVDIILCSNALNFGTTPLSATAKGCSIPEVIIDHKLPIDCFSE